MRLIGILSAAVVLAGITAASGQEMALRGSASDLITFDRWCAEIAHFGGDRCDQRRLDDYDTFRVYRNTVERYEGEFMRERDADMQLMHRLETQDTRVPSPSFPE